jgi:hypothetical protein
MRCSSSLKTVRCQAKNVQTVQLGTPCAAATAFGKAAKLFVVTLWWWLHLQPDGWRGLG